MENQSTVGGDTDTDAALSAESYQWNIGDKCLAPWSRDQQ